MILVVKLDELEYRARTAPQTVSFKDAVTLASHYFGEPRKGSGSHVAIFKAPWPGDPRVNLQSRGSEAKPYQVRQLIKAIDRLKEES